MAVGARQLALAGHTTVTAVAFSPDGTRVLTGSEDNTARLWSVFKSPQDLINTVRTTVPRCLTPMQREAFHLGTPPPRWCYERNLWPFADHGQPYTEGGKPPYGPPPPTWDEKLLAAWDRLGSWFSRSSANSTLARPAILATRSRRMLCIIKSIIFPSIICLNFPDPASTERPGREIPCLINRYFFESNLDDM